MYTRRCACRSAQAARAWAPNQHCAAPARATLAAPARGEGEDPQGQRGEAASLLEAPNPSLPLHPRPHVLPSPPRWCGCPLAKGPTCVPSHPRSPPTPSAAVAASGAMAAAVVVVVAVATAAVGPPAASPRPHPCGAEGGGGEGPPAPACPVEGSMGRWPRRRRVPSPPPRRLQAGEGAGGARLFPLSFPPGLCCPRRGLSSGRYRTWTQEKCQTHLVSWEQKNKRKREGIARRRHSILTPATVIRAIGGDGRRAAAARGRPWQERRVPAAATAAADGELAAEGVPPSAGIWPPSRCAAACRKPPQPAPRLAHSPPPPHKRRKDQKQ